MLNDLFDQGDARQEAVDALNHEILGKQMVVNSEYKANGIDYVTCLLGESQEDVGLSLISDGLVLAELRKEKRLNKLVATYKNAQEKAKSARVSKKRKKTFLK